MSVQSAGEITLEEEEHPYLFLTAQELARIRNLVRREGTYQAARFARTRKAAEAWLEDPIPQPDRGGGISRSFSCPDDGNYLVYERKESSEHRCPKCGKVYGGEAYDGWWRRLAHHEVAYASRDLALTYAITGDVRSAREAARILIDNATLYPTLPALNLSRLGIEALDEVRLLIAFASAYDLIASSGFLSAEERRRIENGYFRNAAELIRVGQGSFVVDGSIGSNFQATIDAGVGIAGLLLRDPGLTAFAITGPVGFNRLMEIGVLENGMWWESSIQYHLAVIRWLLYLTEAAWRSGIDLYRNETFRRMFRLPMQMAFPDGTFPVMNDGVFDQHIDQHRVNAEIYFARTGDESVKSLLLPGKVTHDASWNWAWDLSLTLEPSYDRVQPVRPRSVNLAPNVAILRSVGDNGMHVAMDYGPHGGSHGHPDALNLVIHANGRLQAPDFGNGGTYALKEWREWYKQTVSHNTVVPGETSLFPCTGRLNGFHISPRAKIMDASAATDPYSNQTDQDIYGHPLPALRRTVALLDESFVVDVFRVRSGRSCDWVYRNTGLLQTGQDMGGREAPIGNDNGYQHIKNVKSGMGSGGSWRAIWTQDGQGMALTAVGVEDREYFTGDGYGKRIDETVSMVMVRAGGGNPVFKTVLEPFVDRPSIAGARELAVGWPDICPEGSGIPGVGLEIDRGDNRHYFLLGFCWGEKQFGDISFDGQLAYLSCRRDQRNSLPGYAYLVNTQTVSRGAFSIRTDRMATLYLQRQTQDAYLLVQQGGDAAHLEIGCADWKNASVFELNEHGAPAGEIDPSVENDVLSFKVNPDSKYQIRFR